MAQPSESTEDTSSPSSSSSSSASSERHTRTRTRTRNTTNNSTNITTRRGNSNNNAPASINSISLSPPSATTVRATTAPAWIPETPERAPIPGCAPIPPPAITTPKVNGYMGPEVCFWVFPRRQPGGSLPGASLEPIKFCTADNTPMANIMFIYADQFALNAHNLYFEFEGRAVDGRYTVAQLGLEDNSVVDVERVSVSEWQ